MARLTSLCVYCGSRMPSPDHIDAAIRLGRMLGERGIRLVYGGGHVGLMGVIADAALAAGGEVVGIIPGHLHDIEVGHDKLTELHVVDSMHERKQKMFELSDAFAVLPGGYGTLDETFEMITWRQLGKHDKPIMLVDQDGYWQPFLALVQSIIDKGYADAGSINLFRVVDDIDHLLPAIAAAPEPHPSNDIKKL